LVHEERLPLEQILLKAVAEEFVEVEQLFGSLTNSYE
jgi:hypothetical protein